MKRRIAAVAVLSLAVTASSASAADLAPATGTWKGTAGDSGEAVGFKLQKTGSGYRATSTRLFVVAPCDAPNANDSTAVRAIRARGVTVRLRASGNELRGTRVLKKAAGGKATQTVKIAMRFTSKRRAKVVVNARYATKSTKGSSNTDKCSGRLTVRAKPQTGGKTVTVGGKGGGRALTVTRGDTLKVRLTDNPSTGYSWKLTTRPAASVLDGRGSKFESGADENENGTPIAGAPGKRTFTWKAVGRGTTRIVLANVPPGRQKATGGVRYTVTVR